MSHYTTSGNVNYGQLELSALQVNVRHIVKISNKQGGWQHFFVDNKVLSSFSYYGSVDSFGAVVLVYSEP